MEAGAAGTVCVVNVGELDVTFSPGDKIAEVHDAVVQIRVCQKRTHSEQAIIFRRKTGFESQEVSLVDGSRPLSATTWRKGGKTASKREMLSWISGSDLSRSSFRQ